MTLTVDFNNEQEKVDVGAAMRATVRKAIFNTLVFEGFEHDIEVSVTFTDDEKIRELNKRYRNKDKSTDVLSFPMYDNISAIDNEVGETSLGDIVISLETAKRQGHALYHSTYQEVTFLTVHSVLHLLGYDHEISEEDEEDMFTRQKKIMEIMGY